MKIEKNTYKVLLHRCGDIFPSQDGKFEVASISAWKSLEEVASKFEIENYGEKIELSIDWTGASKYVEEAVLLNKEVFGRNRNNHSLDDLKELVSKQPNPLEIMVCINSKDTSDHFCTSIIELFLSYVFFALNISVPGCANFSSAYVESKDENISPQPLNLACFMLRPVWDWSQKKSWPPISEIKLEDTWNWLSRQNLGSRLIAKNNSERMLFAFFHACNEWQTLPSQLLWLSHALEAIFDLPQINIGKTLRERTFLTLGIPPQNSKKINRLINEFYELRSQFVHGTLKIYHPLCDDGLDNDINEICEEFDTPLDLGFAIILSVFQTLINNNWTEISFVESVKGI